MSNAANGQSQSLKLCVLCRATNHGDHSHCYRCKTPLYYRKPGSLQASWAFLITAFILLFPANFFPITQLTNQGKVTYDTIFTGIMSLVQSDMIPIAIIVFIASILVPWLKIFGIFVVLLAIQLKLPLSTKQLAAAFRVIEWIGRWSMLDLFVISIMVAIVNMGQLLDAKPAPAATAFAAVILFTQLAAKSLDTRLLWDRMENKNDSN
ncbi:paraquat-inducible protein A [Paraferrimonas sedimenticola]|uniref:PqiA family protein n=1 Tax=Paraferrimonas sedimenticola TaxID=375674 RepID=A0AA37RZJ1_9GAMM|nr:paraquat-inducible protein A [Paraferrimonas sedimenticola]GLP98078.1 PqiA family protein [Paraferrimonas sedimenticola]